VFSISVVFQMSWNIFIDFLYIIKYIFSVEKKSIGNLTQLPDLPASVSEGIMPSYYYIIVFAFISLMHSYWIKYLPLIKIVWRMSWIFFLLVGGMRADLPALEDFRNPFRSKGNFYYLVRTIPKIIFIESFLVLHKMICVMFWN